MRHVKTREEKSRENFKALRERLEYTQEKFAEEIGVSQNTVGRLERGETEISSSLLIKISERFHVSTDFLLGFTSNEEGEPPCTASCEELINAQITLEVQECKIKELQEKFSLIKSIVTEKDEKPDCSN